MYIRTARPTDVPALTALVNEHARRGDLLPRTAESIHASLAQWLVGIDVEGDLVACVAFVLCIQALAEVRSLAVADKVKGWVTAVPLSRRSSNKHVYATFYPV